VDAAGLGSGNRICTVVFVDLVEYSEAPVSRQAETKAQFGALLAEVLEQTPAADRLVLDTGDGAALCFLGDPADALFAANGLKSRVIEHGAALGLRLRIGINLGPVRFVKDVNGQPNVIGDGINVAQRVMGFAEPNQILVSRSYYEVVSRLSPEYGQLFQYAGLHRDKHVREHEVYEVQVAASRGDAGAVDAGPEASPRPRFDPGFLARVTSALAREIGPVAKVLVRKAADRATDARSLCEALAQGIPEAGRPAFLAGLADAASALAPPAPDVHREEPAADAPAPERAAEIPADTVARAERLLSRQIGPLARLLVREAARQAKGPRDFFERLATHIDDDEARRVFLTEADR
jgi:class 3 adenylate cyclase